MFWEERRDGTGINQSEHRLIFHKPCFRYHDTIECYDPAEDTWTVVGDMPSSRYIIIITNQNFILLSNQKQSSSTFYSILRSWLSAVALTIRKDLGKEKV